MLRVFLLRRLLALLVAASLGFGGVALAVPHHGAGTDTARQTVPAVAVDCPHHLGMAADQAHQHGDQDGDRTIKKSCHCGLVSCNGWTVAPLVLDLVDLDPAAVAHQAAPALAFRPHPPGVPLQPPRL